MATKRRWMYVPPKPPKPKVPEYLKSVVKTEADEFVESFLKPHFVKEPPKDYQWNYPEKILETISCYEAIFPLVEGHQNVGLFTLGNSRDDPREAGKVITSETYVHSKNMAVIGDEWAMMTGGSANIAFTSMWFHSEMNIAFTDTVRIKNWVAQLWVEHLRVSIDKAKELIGKPDEALGFFKDQAAGNKAAMEAGTMPEGRVYVFGTEFPERDLKGIDLSSVVVEG